MDRPARLAPLAFGLALILALTVTPAYGSADDLSAFQTGSAPLVPFTGTATTTWIASDTSVPAGLAADLSRNQQTETFAVRDASHWRVDVHLTAPLIDSNDQTVVADGTRVVIYTSLFNRAFRMPGGRAQSAPLLGTLLHSGGLPLGTTTAQFINLLKKGSPGVTVRSLGEGEAAARQADIISLAPLVRVSTGPCTGPKACAKKSKGFGSATFWLDHQYGIVLRYETHGLSKQIGAAHGYRYVVTSITFGQGPSGSDLAYTPPVPVTALPSNGTGQGEGGGGPGAQFQAPPGFIAIRAPVAQGRSMQLQGSAYGSEWLSEGTSVAEGLFQDGSGQRFVYVKERVRALGLPAALMTGTPQAAGSCQAWTGAFSGGARYLAMMRGHIAVLVVANKLSTAELVQYAAIGVCAASVVPPPSGQDVQNTALERLEVEIDITRQILGWAIAAAPTAADRQTLKAFDTRLESFDRVVFTMRHRNDPQVKYSPPSFPPPQKEAFSDTVAALRGEMGAAKHMLAEAETAVRSPSDRETLQARGAVFDDLIRAVSGMAGT